MHYLVAIAEYSKMDLAYPNKFDPVVHGVSRRFCKDNFASD